MKSKLKGIFKNLSAMFLLLIVVTAVFIPLGAAKALGLGDLISFDIFSIITEFIASAMIDEEGFLWPIYFLVYHFFNLCLLAVTILVYFGAWLVDVFLDEDIYIRVLDMTDKTSAVYIGWTTVRDACNTFFILFLLLIAFSTILRIQAYNAKNLLPKLIISLFLINFSAIIAMMVIDLGQVFMFEIKTWMGAGFSEGGKPLTSMIDYFNSEYNFESPTEKYLLSDVVGVAFAVAYSVILGLLYIMLALFLMVRIVVFVILVIISPFAFFSIILPGMRTYTSQWWSSLVSHAIFGPIFLFFIFLSGKMAQSMQTFEPIAANDEISSLSYIIAELIPHAVALALLAAAIPVTQKLGAAGSSKIIGGAAGMGKVGIGAVAATKLLGGGAKKVGGGTVGRAHSALKGRSKKYNDLANWTGGKLKSAPIGGRIFIKHESDKAERNKEAVGKHEKVMDNLTDKDKKKYVDSFKLDKNAQAQAQQAMFNLMAKDSGKGLTDARLMKMGYEKDTGIKRDVLDKDGNVTGQEAVMKFDKEKFEKDYGRAVAHGMDTTNIETYRPDLIKDKDDRMDKVRKTVADGNEKNIKLDVLLDEDIDDELQELLGKRRYKVLIDGKSQEEKDGLAKGKENKIIRGMQIEKTQPGKKAKGSLDVNSKEGKEKLFEQQTEIAYLTGTKHKAEKMRKIKGINNDQSLAYEEKVDPEIAKNVVNRMNTDDLVDQDPKFLKDTSHMIEDTSQFSRINRNKYVTTEQSEAIKKSIGDRMKAIRGIKKHEEEYERLEKAAGIMGSGITKPTNKKSDEETKETKTEEPGKKWEETMKEKTGGGGSRGSGSGESSKKNKRSFLGDERGEANLTSAIPKKTKGEKEGGGKVKKDRGSRAAIIDDADTNKPRRSFWKDKSASVGLTGGAKSKTTTDKKAETKPQGEKTGVKKAVDSHKERVREKAPVDLSPENVRKKVVDPAIKTYKEKAPPVIIAADKAIGKALDIASVDKRVAAANIVLKPIINEEIKVNEERRDGIEVSKKGELERKVKRVGKELKPTILENADEGVKAVSKGAGAALEKIEQRGGKAGVAAKVIRPVVESKYVQEKVSGEIRKKADNKEDKKSEAQKTNVETVKQPKTGTLKKIIAGGNLSIAKNMAKGKDPVATNEALIKALEVSGKFDERAKKIEPLVRPMLEKQIEIDKRRQGGEKISQWQEDKEKFGVLTKSLKPLMPKDSKDDGKYIEEVGKLFSELGKEKGGKAGAVMTGAGTVLQNRKAQEVISKEARNKINSAETAKQQATKETKPETVVKTKSVPVVKTNVNSKVDIGGEISKQIEESLKNISNDMVQNINVGVDSSQGITGLDLKELVDSEKIAKLVNEGVDVKSVKDSLKKAQDSFKEFKGSNSGNANTTIFNAGISAAQTALNEALTLKDRKERDVKLVTIKNVLGEIESGMKKQDKPFREGKK